ncbi:hypothetical protein DDB_G0289405 [Dictyostelium discoideum AX4]|uniref:Uncharacterized protein n=1 Tax=Dictyostelium discoideum TaxID=44689 RepID=Q54HJ8_DICDI|nr:hypothetical protein DDB_G0289405 [Dictyostelium discoideum AX4]EAL62730.1 hypothetical protein DDB_G0289405 [Dictyostelium discoideum AX4]|eukprot:XP_636235.1 hypothetical protein DDB_G0289405 [Dictyostelium discoideum AX4]
MLFRLSSSSLFSSSSSSVNGGNNSSTTPTISISLNSSTSDSSTSASSMSSSSSSIEPDEYVITIVLVTEMHTLYSNFSCTIVPFNQTEIIIECYNENSSILTFTESFECNIGYSMKYSLNIPQTTSIDDDINSSKSSINNSSHTNSESLQILNKIN